MEGCVRIIVPELLKRKEINFYEKRINDDWSSEKRKVTGKGNEYEDKRKIGTGRQHGTENRNMKMDTKRREPREIIPGSERRE